MIFFCVGNQNQMIFSKEDGKLEVKAEKNKYNWQD